MRLWWGLLILAVAVLPGCGAKKGEDEQAVRAREARIKKTEERARQAEEQAKKTGVDRLSGPWKKVAMREDVQLFINDGGKGEIRLGQNMSNWFVKEWKEPLRKAIGAKADEDEFEDQFDAVTVTVRVTAPFELRESAPEELAFQMGEPKIESAISDDFLGYVARVRGEEGAKEVAAMREKVAEHAKEVGEKLAKTEYDRLRRVKYKLDFLLLKCWDPDRGTERRAIVYRKQVD
jgi:hypothetical protein